MKYSQGTLTDFCHNLFDFWSWRYTMMWFTFSQSKSTKTIMKRKYTILAITAVMMFFYQCGGKKSEQQVSTEPVAIVEEENIDPLKNKGIGPIKEIVLGPIDQAMVAEGKLLYQQLCTACHKENENFYGPSHAGILERRTPEWIMNMMMNPKEMIDRDPLAKELLIEHNNAEMADQNISKEEARKILEYFRTL